MKTLLVLRHAKASQDASFAVDFDRPLKLRGRRQSLDLGRMVRARDLTFDAIVASPAIRVVETITGVMEGAGVRFEPVYDRRLYNASPETLLEVVREAGDKVERLLIVGHNPGLQHLLLHLAEEDRDGLRGEVASSFPTAALAELRLSVEHWRDVGPRSGRMVSLVRPRDPDSALAGQV
jgi:phosphohistidine phosphatase